MTISRAEWDAASRLNEQGRERADAGDLEGALACYRQAVEATELFEPAWFNMGLIRKRRGEWQLAVECNQRSAALDGAAGDPAWWNLGIAATALRRWDLARDAWGRFGIEIPDGDGELNLDFGPAPVRLDPGGQGEVVWGRRIDPARIVIVNVPTPGSGHRWGDIVLHDGDTRGERKLGDRVLGVFDELERWQPSDVPTIEVAVTVAGAADAAALTDLFDGSGFAAQDWTTSLRRLCARCSQGQPFGSHDHPEPSAETERRFGLAAPEPDAQRLLGEWAASDPDHRRCGGLAIVG